MISVRSRCLCPPVGHISPIPDRFGGINQFSPLFSIASQLLTTVALTVTTTLLIKAGRLRWAWGTGIPLAWDVAVTFTASWQQIFSDDPQGMFFAQRERYADDIDAGTVLQPAKNLSDMHTVVLNSTVDGMLIAVFLLLVILVIGNATIVCVQAVRSPDQMPTAEVPYVASIIDAAPAERREPLMTAGDRD